MASTNHEKPKKSFMSLYKAATASPRHRFQIPELKSPVTDDRSPNNNNINNNKLETKLSFNVSRSWFLRKLPKTVRSSSQDHHEVDVITELRGHEMPAEKKGGGDIVNNGDSHGGGEKVSVVMEGRRSVSHVETNLGSVVSFLQVKVLVSDMPNYMQVHAFRCARRTHDSLDKFSAKHMAYNMKKEFDKVHGPAWHCIVGSSFGSFVTHSTGCFLYFSMDKLYILLFKTKIQKAKA